MRQLRQTWLASIVAVSAAFASTTVFAENALPPVHTAGQLSYLSGGVGSDEIEAIKAEAKRYPWSLEFVQATKTGGVYLSDVDVTILGPKNTVLLNTKSDGPFMLVKLPSGHYQVQATLNGVTQQQAVTIKSGQMRHTVLIWPKK